MKTVPDHTIRRMIEAAEHFDAPWTHVDDLRIAPETLANIGRELLERRRQGLELGRALEEMRAILGGGEG